MISSASEPIDAWIRAALAATAVVVVVACGAGRFATIALVAVPPLLAAVVLLTPRAGPRPGPTS